MALPAPLQEEGPGCLLLTCRKVESLGPAGWTATFAPEAPSACPGEMTALTITVTRDYRHPQPWARVGQRYSIACEASDQ